MVGMSKDTVSNIERGVYIPNELHTDTAATSIVRF